jgi:hypothetical protein
MAQSSWATPTVVVVSLFDLHALPHFHKRRTAKVVGSWKVDV